MKKVIIMAFLISIFPILPAWANEVKNFYSLITTPIELIGRAKNLYGTGFFFYEENRKIMFLVTNYHVLTGFPPEKKSDYVGDRIKIFIHLDEANPGNVQGKVIPLFTSKKNPIWLTNENFPMADIAVIPLPPDFLKIYKGKALTRPNFKKDFPVGPNSKVA